MIQSMSHVGRCTDNRPMENFWGVIKVEMFRLTTYETLEKLVNDAQQYITFYHTKRITLKMRLRLSIPAYTKTGRLFKE